MAILTTRKAKDIYQEEIRPHSVDLYQLVAALERKLKKLEGAGANSPAEIDDPSILLIKAKTLIENKK